MVATPSTMTPLGTSLPSFALPATDGKEYRSDDFIDQPLLVMFICNHCPFVVHLRSELASFGIEYQGRGISIVAINSNDAVTYPADSFENMKKEYKTAGYSFPYLYDESQDVAKRFHAACTPDFFLFNAEHSLVYRGQFDASRPTNSIRPSGISLREACDELLRTGQISANRKQVPSLGCNIKWRVSPV